ncbi:MAG: hypothetical protein ACK4TP_19460 [Hyphomicrobium sp.]
MAGSEMPSQEVLKPVTAQEFGSVDFEAALANNSTVQPLGLYLHFKMLASRADDNPASTEAHVFGLLANVCSIHLKPEDPAEPWGPMFSTGNQRSAIPSDFKGEQSAVFVEILHSVRNPGLRARLADIAWTNDRKTATGAGKVAIDAYRECAEGLLGGAFKPHLEGRALSEALKNMQRALAIARATTRKDSRGRAQLDNALKETALRLYVAAKDGRDYKTFCGIADLMLQYGLSEPASVAADCEALASASPEGAYPLAIRDLWKLAARIHQTAGEKEAEQRCRRAVVGQTLAMREHVGDAGAKAHWVNQALSELRHVQGQDELEDQLVVELRHLQRAATKEMTPISTTIDLSESVDQITEEFENLSFSESMRRFALLARSTPIEELKESARQQPRDYPLQSLLPVVQIDREGKTVAVSPGASANDDLLDAWYRQQALRHEAVSRHCVAWGLIEPARLTIHERFLVTERHLEPIVRSSPFVLPSQAPLLALGFARFFQGDFRSAAHLIIPQLEPCLRHILRMNGHDPVRHYDDGTEEDYDLNAMFRHMRAQLDDIFDEATVYELDLLYVGRPGPSLRNELAHGKIGAADCFHPDIIYGCWLIYRLFVLFLLRQWERLAPELDAAV